MAAACKLQLEKRAQAAALSQDDDPDLPDEESHAAKLILERVAGEKRSILDGIRLIAQNWPADSAAEASYWFAKNLRHGIICALSRKAFANPDDEPEIETVFGRMPSDERAQWLFNVARSFQVRIVDAQSHERLFRAWLDADSLGCRDLLDEKWIARALHNNKLAHAAVTKFLLPAMLWHHYRGLCDELRWDFRNCIVERVI